MCCLLAVLLAGCGGGAATAAKPPPARTTPSATVRPSVVYVALAASDGVGVGATNPATEAYVPRIIARLPKDAARYNLSVSGFHIAQSLAQELPQAIAIQPTLVTVWLVGNDFRDCTPLDQYARDLDTMLGRLQSQTKARVFVGNTPDMSQLPYFAQEHAPQGGACVAGKSPAEVRALAQQWNATINPIIAKHGDVLVDLFNSDLAAHPEYVYSDGFHPSSAGYQVLADLFWAQIAKSGAVPAS